MKLFFRKRASENWMQRKKKKDCLEWTLNWIISKFIAAVKGKEIFTIMQRKMQTSHPALDIQTPTQKWGLLEFRKFSFSAIKICLLHFKIWSTQTPQKLDKPAGFACIEMHSTLFSVFTFIWRKTIKIYLQFLLATQREIRSVHHKSVQWQRWTRYFDSQLSH